MGYEIKTLHRILLASVFLIGPTGLWLVEVIDLDQTNNVPTLSLHLVLKR